MSKPSQELLERAREFQVKSGKDLHISEMALLAEQIVRECADLMNDDLEDTFPDLWRRYSRNEITLRKMESAAILRKFGLEVSAMPEEMKPVERDISMGLTERRIRGRIQAHGGLAGIGDILANFRQASAAAALERAAQVAREHYERCVLTTNGVICEKCKTARDIENAIRALKGRE